MSAATVAVQASQQAAPHGNDVAPTEQTFVVPDDSLAPNVNAGDYLTFAPCDEAELKTVVLVETPDGRLWIRRLLPGPDGTVIAATNWGHADWTDFKVIARAVRRWSKFTSI